MLITGRPRQGKPIDFDNILIDKSKKCTGLKGDFWNKGSTLDSNPYRSGEYTLKEKSLKLRIGEGGNGFTLQNKGRVILYRKGDTVVGCGKLTKKKKKCKEDKAPTKAPSASPTGASTPVATTRAPTTSPVTMTAAPVATTGAPTVAPVSTTAAPVATTGVPTVAPVATTAAPVVTTGAPTVAPIAATAAPVATTGAPTRSPSPPPTAA